MAPPCYSDLGKQARDIFTKGYNFSLVKLDCKTKTASGMEFTVNGSSNSEVGKVAASLETKYHIPDYGITFKEKWNTDNILATELSVEDQLLKGLKFAFDSTFAPQSGKKTGVIKAAYKMDNLHINGDVDLDYNGPVVHGSTVLGIHGWLAGLQVSYDTAQNKLNKHNFSLAYNTKDFVMHTNVNDGQEFGGSIYQKVTPNLDTGIQVAWTANSNVSKFGFGCVYNLDDDTSLRAKVNNSSQIGLGITHKLREGIQISLSAMIDGKNFNQGGHKLGVGLNLEA